ncbi:MAG: MoxR family ATPase [bacterium]|nr:MoxR family ATPase [bacterium]
MSIIGRERELGLLQDLLSVGRHILIEGPVGVGKTYLVLQHLRLANRHHVRVDGDARYSEQKLTGWFDPPLVMQAGYRPEHFIEGPLVQAMRQGCVLFINELNRMPEGVQNVLLPALDEGIVQVPRLGTIEAAPGFQVIATQNPAEYVATQRLSEAVLDRFESVVMGYQPRQEEARILEQVIDRPVPPENLDFVLELLEATRKDQTFQRGASIRAAIAWMKVTGDGSIRQMEATRLESLTESALRNRVQLADGAESDLTTWIARFIKKNAGTALTNP